MQPNPFINDIKYYTRNLDYLNTYINDSAHYLNIMSGKSIEECTAFIKSNVIKNRYIPNVIFLDKNKEGDREMYEMSYEGYLLDTANTEQIMAPTFTTYKSSKELQSPLSSFITNNLKKRSVAKKKMFLAKKEGNAFEYSKWNINQTFMKLLNNSISGAHASSSNSLYNKTTHSTLTSNCRVTSGYGNANNEKFLSGNRHYYSKQIIINNIVSITNPLNTNLNNIKNVILKYNLHIPTVEEILECILYSSNLYFRNKNINEELVELISKLSDVQRAAFLYIGDLYHLKKYNEDFVRNLLFKLSSKMQSIDDNLQPEKEYNEYIINLATMICNEEVRNKEVFSNQESTNYKIFLSTCKNIQNVINDHRSLIKSFWCTRHMPNSIAMFPNSIRRCVLVSDTDSTIFTEEKWIEWYFGEAKINNASIAVSSTITFLASNTTAHLLALMSGNLGIEEKNIFTLSMKNEYFFQSFVPTNVGKHYYASIGAREGVIYDHPELEIKGVHLKSSTINKSILDDAHALMLKILTTAANGEKIVIKDVLKLIKNKELDIIQKVAKADNQYLRNTEIKTMSSYINKEKTPQYVSYLFWNEVFGNKYGRIHEPPYKALKVPTQLDTPSNVTKWLDTIVDETIKNNIINYLTVNKRKILGTTFLLPEPIVANTGLPIEIQNVVDTRRIIMDNCNIYYQILETLGIYITDDNITKLVSDIY